MIGSLAGVATALAAGAAMAQSPAPSTLSAVVVPGGPRPKVTASFPAQGATVSAGELAFKITFDQPMTPARWAYAQAPGGAFPACLSHPRLLADGRTFVLLCQVKPNTNYAIDLGPAPGFEGKAGRDAAASVLTFSTNDQIVDNLHDALDEAGLIDADEPIMTWNDDGKTPPMSGPPAG